MVGRSDEDREERAAGEGACIARGSKRTRTRRQRITLAAAILLFAAPAVKAGPASGGPSGEVEGTLYGGEASGGWSCGPSATVGYAAVGGDFRFRTSSTPKRGFVITAGGSAEHRGYRFESCYEECGENETIVPPSKVVGAGHLTVGYDWRWFGFRAGALVFPLYEHHGDRWASTVGIPDLQLRVGLLEGFRFEAGLGAYDVPTIARPGLWGGIAHTFDSGLELAFRAGLQVTFDSDAGGRFSLMMLVPASEKIRLGFGAALSEGLRLEPEGQAFARGQLF